jgi:hypothetical protein
MINSFPTISLFFKLIGLLLYIIQVLSHLFTMFINPGLPDKNSYISSEVINIFQNNSEYDTSFLKKYRKCDICNILVQAQNEVVHCESCNICVEG